MSKPRKYKKRTNKRKNKKKNRRTNKIIGGKTIDKYNRYIQLNVSKMPVCNEHYTKKILHKPLHELVAIAKKVIADMIEAFTYSLLPYYFLPESVPIEHHDIVVSKYKSGNCVSLGYMVLEELKKKGIEAILIPATIPPRLIQPGYPEYSHVVATLETNECFILCDPAYFILTPVVVKKNGEPFVIYVEVFKETWCYTYDERQKRINVKTNGIQICFYKICVIENPTFSISYPVNTRNRRIPIIKYSSKENRKLAHLSIRIDTQKLEGYNVHHSSPDHWYERFDWSTCFIPTLSEEQQLKILSQWEGLSLQQCTTLNYDKDLLVKQIFAIMKSEWNRKNN
jgi:hypothetical protein